MSPSSSHPVLPDGDSHQSEIKDDAQQWLIDTPYQEWPEAVKTFHLKGLAGVANLKANKIRNEMEDLMMLIQSISRQIPRQRGKKEVRHG